MSISVVIPAYNAVNFLGETLGSVFRQTLLPDEVLVIDDGSTDDTAALAASFGPPVRVLRRANAKFGATRNLGVQEAKSEWIALLDADDVWEPNKLQRQMEELARHPDADLCYTARVLMFQNGNTVRFGKVMCVPPASHIRESLFTNTTFLSSSVIIRRSTYLAVGGCNVSLRYTEDWDLWLRLFHAGIKFAACQEPLLRYRIHSNSVSRKAIPALHEAKALYRCHVYPYLPPSTRWISLQKSQSGQEAAAAYILREENQPGYIFMMLRSILRYPFNEPHRYKGLLYMLYTRLTKSPAK